MTQAFLEDVPVRNLTSTTIRRMFELVDRAKTDPKFQEIVYSITRGLPNKAYRKEVDRIFHWIKKNVRYTRDPYGVELVQDPWTTLDRGRGDCDDLSILLGAMAEIMGCPVRFCTVSTRADREPVHVYPDVFVGGRWVSYDPTVGSSVPGWKPTQGITDRICWKRGDVGISGYDEKNVEGLGEESSERDSSGDPFFKASVEPVDLVPGVPTDVSHTYADQDSGSPFLTKRWYPGAPYAPVARYADEPNALKTGGGAYGKHLPIRPLPDLSSEKSFAPRSEVPRSFDQWGRLLPWKTNPNAMLPRPNTPEGSLMSEKDVYGLDFGKFTQDELDAVVSAIHADTIGHVRKGFVHPSRARGLSEKLVDAVKTGDTKLVNPSTAPATTHALKAIGRARGLSARARGVSMRAGVPRGLQNPFGEGDESVDWMPALYGFGEAVSDRGLHRRDRGLHRNVLALVRQKLPGVFRKYGISSLNRGFSGLGDVTPQEAQAADSIAKGITNAITGTVGTDDAQAIGKAVDSGLDAAAQIIAPQKSSGVMASVGNIFKGWTVPVIVLGGLLLAGGAMAGKKRKFRRNPSRRRSYRRYYRRGGRGGRKGSSGGFDFSTKNLLLLGLAAGGAYLFLKKPTASMSTVQAGVVKPMSVGERLISSIASLFKTPSTGGTSPAASVATSVSKLVSSGASSPTVAPYGTSTDSSGEQISLAPPSQSTDWRSSLVTSLPESSPEPSSSEIVTTL